MYSYKQRRDIFIARFVFWILIWLILFTIFYLIHGKGFGLIEYIISMIITLAILLVLIIFYFFSKYFAKVVLTQEFLTIYNYKKTIRIAWQELEQIEFGGGLAVTLNEVFCSSQFIYLTKKNESVIKIVGNKKAIKIIKQYANCKTLESNSDRK